jgi:hypothetical protein
MPKKHRIALSFKVIALDNQGNQMTPSAQLGEPPSGVPGEGMHSPSSGVAAGQSEQGFGAPSTPFNPSNPSQPLHSTNQDMEKKYSKDGAMKAFALGSGEKLFSEAYMTWNEVDFEGVKTLSGKFNDFLKSVADVDPDILAGDHPDLLPPPPTDMLPPPPTDFLPPPPTDMLPPPPTDVVTTPDSGPTPGPVNPPQV